MRVPNRQRTEEIANAMENSSPLSTESPTNLDGRNEDVILKINSYIYGLPESGRQWWLKLRAVLIDNGLNEHPSWE